MKLRTPNVVFRPADRLDLSPRDANRLNLYDGERGLVRSRHGETVLPVKINPAVKEGELFATFHTVQAMVDRLTGPERDRIVHTPEYKVVAVGLEKISSAPVHESVGTSETSVRAE
jgi:formate dehydrogenase major subunit